MRHTYPIYQRFRGLCPLSLSILWTLGWICVFHARIGSVGHFVLKRVNVDVVLVSFLRPFLSVFVLHLCSGHHSVVVKVGLQIRVFPLLGGLVQRIPHRCTIVLVNHHSDEWLTIGSVPILETFTFVPSLCSFHSLPCLIRLIAVVVVWEIQSRSLVVLWPVIVIRVPGGWNHFSGYRIIPVGHLQLFLLYPGCFLVVQNFFEKALKDCFASFLVTFSSDPSTSQYQFDPSW